MYLAAAALIFGGVTVAWVGWLGRTDRLPRQGWAGMRTKTTMANDETWRAAHRASGAAIIAAGAFMALGGLAVVLIRPGDAGATAMLFGGMACSGLALVVGGVRGQQSARAVPSDNGVAED